MNNNQLVHPDWDIRLSFFSLPKVRKIAVNNAPEFMVPVRAMFISDIHLRRSVNSRHFTQLIDLIRSQSADILLLGGDYGEGEDQCKRLFKALGDLHFPLGAYAVPGNNDNYDNLNDITALGNVKLLRNRACEIDLGSGTLTIGGSDEPKYGTPDTHGLFANPNAYRILLSHYPCSPECDCDLQLSGHTHGGQMNLFGITPYHIGFERKYELSAIRGLHDQNGRYLFVGNGIGVSRLPLRVGATPEIYVLQFHE